MIDYKKITTLHDIQSKEDAIFLKDLIDTYIIDLPTTVKDIVSFVERNDCEKTKFLTHRLKGSSLTIGVDVIADLSRKIEESVAGNKITEETRILVINLLEVCDRIASELKLLKEKYIQV